MTNKNIEMYLSEGFNINSIQLHENFLHEAFILDGLKNKTKQFMQMFDKIKNIKNGVDAQRFVKNNLSSLININKNIMKSFDPFSDSDVVIQNKTSNPIPKTNTSPTPQEKKEADDAKNKYIEMLMKFVNYITKKFKNISIDKKLIIKIFNMIYYALIRSIEIIGIVYIGSLLGSYVVATMSFVYVLSIFINLIYIKRNNEDVNLTDALLSSAKKTLDMIKKWIKNVQTEDTFIALIFVSIAHIIKTISESIPAMTSDISISTLLTIQTLSGQIILIAMLGATALYLLLSMYDRISHNYGEKNTRT